MSDPKYFVRAGQSGALMQGTPSNVLTAKPGNQWEADPGGGGGTVTSVFGRVGAVTAQSGDYNATQITNTSGVAGASVKDALNTLAAVIAAGVLSVFGRVGNVTAQSGDYAASQVTNDSAVVGATTKDALNTLNGRVTGVSSVFGRAGAVVAAGGDYAASQVTNDSGVAGAAVSNALNTLNAPINLTGARVVVGPANSFLGSDGVSNSWQTKFAAPANPGDNGKVVLASAGDFSYLGAGTTGNALIWNGSAWAAGNDFGANNLTTTGGFVGNSGTSFLRVGLASGSGSVVASAASGGNIRGARGANGFTLQIRDNTDANDLVALASDTVSGPGLTLGSTSAGGFSPVIAAPSAGTVTLRVGTSSTQVQLTTAVVSSLIPIIQFFSTVTNGTFGYQGLATNGATGKKLFWQGQDCSGTTSTGGDTDLRPGSGTTAGGKGRLMSGGGAVSSAQRFAWNDTGISFFTAAPVAQQTPTGSRGGNAALASLLTALALTGLIVDGTSA